MIRRLFNFSILLTVSAVSRLFWRHRLRWVAKPEGDPWGHYSIVAVLNHTSLYDWLWAGTIPIRFLWRISGHALVPIADQTANRPLVGRFFRLLIPEAVPISREADHTWDRVLEVLSRDHMLIIFPEGRMKRANGLDKHGRPMTVRGGIADILEVTIEGRMLLAYSAGLHHVQVPGQTLPNLFRKVHLTLEAVDIGEYKREVAAGAPANEFKRRVKRDLERRRDLYCPQAPGNPVPERPPHAENFTPVEADSESLGLHRETRQGS